MDCIFCKIVSGEIPAKILFEDELCLAFADLHPQAPTHVLVIPKEHVASLAVLAATGAHNNVHPGAHNNEALVGHLQISAAILAEQLGLKKGFRTVINTGSDGGQTVDHLHVHLLGGRGMSWPPG